ncbi:Calcineurin-like phosphoesterase superfamily domain protein [Aquisphaera giovannonii]|uniref:Calcineurin-like phosphoesterase superfamily domain protein n=1 Tax=Aquisphaera giovannonii TaxID=406548 RepID=A0A5B9W2R6_9BACT|nr:metallophosphoesterase [Aquisphaera giovannonii]QEH34240.1 Calcineurin-like phosphoesterase superfamily domain protein [Aquisphaera giovannonii]
MKILAISDLHGELSQAREALGAVRPDVVLSCGDWGDPGEIDEADFGPFLDRGPLLTTFGNHDPRDLLAALRNRDGSPVLIGQGEIREIGGLRVAAIGGIWAKSHSKPYYVTDEDVAGWSKEVAARGPIDVLLTHGCPIGMADRTPSGRRGGQRCFAEAFRTIAPRLHLCGHLHVAQGHTTRDGRMVINVGATPEGSIAILDFDPATGALAGRLARVGEEAGPG